MSTIKNCLVRQPAGLGDILFCQKIAKKIIEKYNLNIIWPVIPNFIDDVSYIKSNRIEYVDIHDTFPGQDIYHSSTNTIIDTDQLLYIPLQHADQHQLHDSVMVCKYKLVNLDYTDWVEYITFNRDTEKENALFSDVLGLTEGDEYIFINKNFGSPPGTRVCEHIDINPSSMRVVNMEFYTGFSVFDWCKVIENATQIHTVDTIIVCIIEKLITCNNLNIYSRWTPPSFTSVKPILSARWKYNK